ncbi:MAG: hypothetical protein ABI140_16220 [Jatrophihabitantaceae bacterium]
MTASLPDQVPAQFQLYQTATDAPVRWRLLSGNHRPIGRSAHAFDTIAECLDSLAELSRVLDQLDLLLTRVPGNLWIWRAGYQGTDLALSAHAYDRQIRAMHAQAQFQQRVATARINELVMVTATRRWRSLAGAGSRESSR